MIFSLPARYVLAILLFIAEANLHSMRVNMSIAIVAMVNNSVTLATNTTKLENIACQEIFMETRNQSLSHTQKGTTTPATNILISNWAPVLERSRIISIVVNGASVGSTCGMMLSGVIADSDVLGGWPAIFYFSGAAGCIWFLLWIILAHETPSEHPWITDTERTYIQTNLDHSGKQVSSTRIPWRCILGSSVTWVLVFTCSTSAFCVFTVMAEIPTYLSSILHYDIEMIGHLFAVAFILHVILSYFSSHAADKLRERETFSITTIRKLMHSVGCFIPSVCYIGLAFGDCRRFLNVFLLGCAVASAGFTVSGCIAAIIDVNPTLSGITTGLCFTASSLGGILGPYIIGKLISSGPTTENWKWAFMILAGSSFLSGATFVLFGTAELQQWGPVSADATKPPGVNEELPNWEKLRSVSDSSEVTYL